MHAFCTLSAAKRRPSRDGTRTDAIQGSCENSAAFRFRLASWPWRCSAGGQYLGLL